MNTFIILFKAKGCILRWTGRVYILTESNMKCFLVSCLWKRERWPEESLKSLAISVYCSSSCSCTKGSMISCLQTWNIIYIIFGLFFFSPASEMFVKEQITSIYSLLLMIMKARFFYFFFLIVSSQHCYLSFPEHHRCTLLKRVCFGEDSPWGRRVSHHSRLIVQFYYSDFHMNVCLHLLPPNSLGNMFIDITVQWKINVTERFLYSRFDSTPHFAYFGH